MFDIGFPELILIAIVALLVIGPERLPETLRTLGLWIGRIRRSFTSVKAEIEREIGMDDIRRQLHNEAVMEELKRLEREVRLSVNAGASAGEERPGAVEERPGAGETPASPENRIEPPPGAHASAAGPAATAPATPAPPEAPGDPTAAADPAAAMDSAAAADSAAAEDSAAKDPQRRHA